LKLSIQIDPKVDSIISLNTANLTFANLERANLNGADLKNAELIDANLERANLNGANLKNTNLYSANLNGANLKNTNLNGSYLDGAYLNSAENLTNEQIKSACFWEKAIYTDTESVYTYHSESESVFGGLTVKDPKANQRRIDEIKQDKTSDPPKPPDCSKWK
jgi:uncharacterized protein YjbI with pentapeptide repeats